MSQDFTNNAGAYSMSGNKKKSVMSSLARNALVQSY